MFGGRLAEEIIFGSDAVTTGAQNDIQRASAIAREMVTKWGLSSELGPLAYQDPEGEVFLGQAVTQKKNISEETARRIDEEVRNVIDRNYNRARGLLTDHLDILHAMAHALMQYETLEAQQIDDIMAGRKPRPPEDWDSDDRADGNAETPVDNTRSNTRPQVPNAPLGSPSSA